jgi:hypothetical protein
MPVCGGCGARRSSGRNAGPAFEQPQFAQADGDVAELQRSRAEGAHSLQRRGQRLCVSVCRNRSELHLSAGKRRRGWGGLRGLRARRGDLSGQLGLLGQGGAAWSVLHSWIPDVARGVNTVTEEPEEGEKAVAAVGGAPPQERTEGKEQAASGASKSPPPPGALPGQTVLRAEGHRISAWAVHPDADVIYTGSDEGAVLGWDVSGGGGRGPPQPWRVLPPSLRRPAAVTALHCCRRRGGGGQGKGRLDGALVIAGSDGSLRAIDPRYRYTPGGDGASYGKGAGSTVMPTLWSMGGCVCGKGGYCRCADRGVCCVVLGCQLLLCAVGSQVVAVHADSGAVVSDTVHAAQLTSRPAQLTTRPAQLTTRPAQLTTLPATGSLRNGAAARRRRTQLRCGWWRTATTPTARAAATSTKGTSSHASAIVGTAPCTGLLSSPTFPSLSRCDRPL